MLEAFAHASHHHAETTGIPALAFVAFLLMGFFGLVAVAVYAKNRSSK